MSSDAVILTLAQNVGELTGTLKQSLKAQEETNRALFELLDKHDKRITKTENIENKMLAAAGVSALGGTGIFAALTKFFHGG